MKHDTAVRFKLFLHETQWEIVTSFKAPSNNDVSFLVAIKSIQFKIIRDVTINTVLSDLKYNE